MSLFIELVIGRNSACHGPGLELTDVSLGLSVSTVNTGLYCKARQRLPLSLIKQLINE